MTSYWKDSDRKCSDAQVSLMSEEYAMWKIEQVWKVLPLDKGEDSFK